MGVVDRKFRLMVVEDHAMVAEGLVALLSSEEDLEIVGTAATAAAAVAMAREQQPDVVLMDFRLPDGDGASVTSQIREEFPETQVVMLTGLGDDAMLARAVEAGCAGFLSKDDHIEAITSAIRSAAQGEVVITPQQLVTLLDRMHRRAEPEHDLTEREMEVLRLVALGTTTEEVGERLAISPHTVRNHVRNILTKLHAHSKLEAVALAARAGIITIDPA